MNETIHLPPFINYDCQTCGWCCRQRGITFSRDDVARLAQQDWPAVDPAIPATYIESDSK